MVSCNFCDITYISKYVLEANVEGFPAAAHRQKKFLRSLNKTSAKKHDFWQNERNWEVEGYRQQEERTTLALKINIHCGFFQNNEHSIRVKVYETELCVLMWRNLRNDGGESRLQDDTVGA